MSRAGKRKAGANPDKADEQDAGMGARRYYQVVKDNVALISVAVAVLGAVGSVVVDILYEWARKGYYAYYRIPDYLVDFQPNMSIHSFIQSFVIAIVFILLSVVLYQWFTERKGVRVKLVRTACIYLLFSVWNVSIFALTSYPEWQKLYLQTEGISFLIAILLVLILLDTVEFIYMHFIGRLILRKSESREQPVKGSRIFKSAVLGATVLVLFCVMLSFGLYLQANRAAAQTRELNIYQDDSGAEYLVIPIHNDRYYAYPCVREGAVLTVDTGEHMVLGMDRVMVKTYMFSDIIGFS